MIHKYAMNGFYIVLDINSGAVHVVDELLYRLLDFITELPTPDSDCPRQALDALAPQYGEEYVRSAYADILELAALEQLFSKDEYGEFAVPLLDSPIKALCLHVAHDCNLRCQYCFASTGDFGAGRKLMEFDTAKRAIDFLIARSGQRRNLEVDFFGGEPLMNFEVVKRTVEYARSIEQAHGKNFRFTITTNGVLLDDEITDYINREMSNAVLSLDGRDFVNDNMRKLVDGVRGSYDIITPKFQRFVEQRGDRDYYVRGTFSRLNKDFAQDVLHMHELGFEQLSIEPVVCDPALPYSIRYEDLPEIMDEYERLAKIILEKKQEGKSFNFFHYMIDLEQGPCVHKRLRGCGAGGEYIAVTPDGEIYPCHQLVGNPDWLMGNIEDGVLNRNITDIFAHANVYTKEECKNCWARFYCSGGCNANGIQYCGDILQPYEISCILQKKRIECAIMMKAAQASDGE